MEYYASQKLKEEWKKKPCDHPHFEKVYYTGAFLINYSCTTCGADFTISQKLEIEESRKNEAVSKMKSIYRKDREDQNTKIAKGL